MRAEIVHRMARAERGAFVPTQFFPKSSRAPTLLLDLKGATKLMDVRGGHLLSTHEALQDISCSWRSSTILDIQYNYFRLLL